MVVPNGANTNGARANGNGASILPLDLEGVGFEAGGRRLIHDLSARFAAGPWLLVGARGFRCPASLRHALLAESLGKPSLWVIINAPWYKRDRTWR